MKIYNNTVKHINIPWFMSQNADLSEKYLLSIEDEQVRNWCRELYKQGVTVVKAALESSFCASVVSEFKSF